MEDVEELSVKKKGPSTSSSVWGIVKPFMNGGVAGVLPVGAVYLLGSYLFRFLPAADPDPHIQLHIRNAAQTMQLLKQVMPSALFLRGISMATLLGSYEFLTRKVESMNDGSPLTFYQDVGCALTSGGIRTCICYPLAGPVGSGLALAATHRNYFRGIFSNITQVVRDKGVLALWRGASRVIPATLAHRAVMLVSYDRCRLYLKETYGLREDKACLGAGLFSGLSSGASAVSISYSAGLIHIMQSRGVKSPGSFLFYLLKGLTPGRSGFYTQLVKQAVYSSPSIVSFWWALEAIREFEESVGL